MPNSATPQEAARPLICQDLPTSPRPMGRILVSGASGYIGGRLVPELLARGYTVRMMVRGGPEDYRILWPEAEVVVADALNRQELEHALEGVEVAYYLIHSLQLGPKEFEAADIESAVRFKEAAESQGVKRIIYLGGLGDSRNPLSSHLRNRIEVARKLRAGPVPVTILRAATIIGSGSASYEIIQHLIRRLGVIFTPRWAKNLCQPIAIRDVIQYLVGVLEVPETSGRSFDIGGRDVLTYEEMLRCVASIRGKRVRFVYSPISNISFFAYWASLLTPVPNAITQCLMQGLKNDVVCRNDTIHRFVPIDPISYQEAVIRAMSREEQDRVYTRWSDAYPPAHELALRLEECRPKLKYKARYSLLTDKDAQHLFRSVCHIGGRQGWFYGNWIWRLRGALDRLLLGVGTLRGRRSYSYLRVNDVIDWWRVEDVKEPVRLLLRAEMRLPGRAWLEFTIAEEGGKRRLAVTAYYDTRSILGHLYWYLCLPGHRFIFKELIRGVERRS